MGICKYCGKEIESSRIGGHTSFCKENPNYKRNMERSSQQFIKVNEEKRANRDCGTCLYCGKPLNKPGKKFCNNSCAAKFNNKKRAECGYTAKGKTKIVLCNKCGSEMEVDIHSACSTWICDECKGTIYGKYKCICKICGNEFYSQRKSSCHCSSKCSHQDPEIKEKLRQKQLLLISEGKHQGWQSRNIRSYPEKFWKEVLDNNHILYEQESYIRQYKYFLDFLIKKNNILIDLEIDGSQHKRPNVIEKDKIRDERLKDIGYIIYRIPWNEINTDQGKEIMKIKIDNFLEFYRKI